MPTQKKIISIAADHAGYDLKTTLIKFLETQGYKIIDLGCNSAEKSVDYPDYANKLAKNIAEKKSEFGVLVCGSGIGVSIAANRFKQVRAALCINSKMAKLSRLHNDANVICFGARLTSEKSAIAALKIFLTTEFEGGRHDGRVAKLSK